MFDVFDVLEHLEHFQLIFRNSGSQEKKSLKLFCEKKIKKIKFILPLLINAYCCIRYEFIL